jgi:dihydroorotase
MPVDLLLTGADVIDAGGGHVGRYDVAVHDGRIAAVAPDLPRVGARQVVDLAGRLLTPGLVDLHTHVHPGATFWGIDPDPVAWYTGVTTWVDAGSAGAYSLGSLRAAALAADVRIRALLNISAAGLVAPTGECRDLANCDVDLAVATIADNRDLVAGVKVRIEAATVGAHGLLPLHRAITAAQAAGVPVMVHVGLGPPDLAAVLPLLRPGDIVTHCASARAAGLTGGAGPPGGAGPTGGVHPAVRDAYAAGVRLDLGHGAGGFSFDVFEAQLEAGLVPHTVSTDLHARCLYGPVFDLPTTMTKMLAVGLPLADVVAAATVRPAQALGLPDGVGTLAIGAPADLAVFTVEEGDFELVDAHRRCRRAARRLVNDATYVAGRLLPPRLPAAPPSWIELTDAQHAALRRRTRAVRALLTTPLVGADGLVEQFPISKETDPCPSA